jgi:hypothetical protein
MPIDVQLIVVGGKAKKAKVAITLPTVIGRSRGAGLTVAHPMISRRHCELFDADGLLMIRDLGSLNGTVVAGQRIKQSPLPPDAEFVVGPLTFRAQYAYKGDLSKLPPSVLAEPDAATEAAVAETEAPDFEVADEPAPTPPDVAASAQKEPSPRTYEDDVLDFLSEQDEDVHAEAAKEEPEPELTPPPQNRTLRLKPTANATPHKPHASKVTVEGPAANVEPVEMSTADFLPIEEPPVMAAAVEESVEVAKKPVGQSAGDAGADLQKSAVAKKPRKGSWLGAMLRPSKEKSADPEPRVKKSPTPQSSGADANAADEDVVAFFAEPEAEPAAKTAPAPQKTSSSSAIFDEFLNDLDPPEKR